MKSSPKISFIIPVYNVAPYLCKCVDSILAQDYNDYEIILVDDGSTDSCGAICDEYVRIMSEGLNGLTNERIRVIHQKNGGLSVARNSGIAVAKGEYICFLDSDDYWSPNVLGSLMAQVNREKLDVLRFDYQNVRVAANNQFEIFRPDKFAHMIEERHEVVDGETYLNDYMDYECYAWQFIIKRELACEFVQGIHYEDVEWMPRMMLQAKRVNSSSLVVYNYFIRPGSIAHSHEYKNVKKNVDDILVGMRTLTNLINQYPNVKWLHRLHSSIAYDILNIVADVLYKDRRFYIDHLSYLKAFPLVKFKVSNQGKRKVYIINHFGPNVYCILMHYRNQYKKLKKRKD